MSQVQCLPLAPATRTRRCREFPPKSEGYMTKFAAHRTLKSIASCKLTFDGKAVVSVCLIETLQVRFRVKRQHRQSVSGLVPLSQGQNLAFTVLCVPYSHDSGPQKAIFDPTTSPEGRLSKHVRCVRTAAVSEGSN